MDIDRKVISLMERTVDKDGIAVDYELFNKTSSLFKLYCDRTGPSRLVAH